MHLEAAETKKPESINRSAVSPQMKQVVFRTSSFFCFSLLRSAKVSMMTPKMRLRTMMMTMKKNSKSYITLAANSGSWDRKRTHVG